MKTKIFIVIAIGLSGVFLAQKESKFGIEIRTGLVSGIGNQFFADAFQPSFGFDFGLRFRAGQNWGVRLNTGTSSLKAKDINVYGNFNRLYFSSSKIGGFYTFPLKERLNLEAKLFFGSFSIKGTVEGFEKPYLQNGLTYGVGSDLSYDLTQDKSFTVIGSLDLSIIHSSMNIQNNTFKNYYNNSTLLTPNIGIRYNF